MLKPFSGKIQALTDLAVWVTLVDRVLKVESWPELRQSSRHGRRSCVRRRPGS